jgi:hypothetical protein
MDENEKDEVDVAINWFVGSLKKYKWLIIFGFIFLFILSSMVSCHKSSPGKGQKVGQIVKINHQGFMFKTDEAELIRGGLTDGSGAIGSAPFDFTIDDKDLLAKAKEYMQNQTEVLITYKISYVYLSINSENQGIYLLDIQPVKK